MKFVAALALITAYAFGDGDGALADTAPTASEPSATPGATLQTELERRVAAIERSGIVVGSIDGDGVTVFKAGTSGTARPLDEDTLFEIGSVTKTFTATLLATMVLDGSVNLEDPVANYMPAGVTVPARNGKAITLLDLATQRSGLPRLPDNMNAETPNDPYAKYTADDMYAFVSHYTLTRDPGETFEYSNIGVALLGQALANRAGVPYETLLKHRVLDPLGMSDTAVELSRTQLQRFAAGATADGDTAARRINFITASSMRAYSFSKMRPGKRARSCFGRPVERSCTSLPG